MKYVLGLCMLVMVFPCIVEGANEAPKTGFADYLFKKGEFDRAITEYERVLYETHEAQPLKDQVLYYKEALCYKGLGENETALTLLEQVISGENAELKKLSLFQEGLLYYEQQRYVVAEENFKTFLAQYPNDALAADATYMRSVVTALRGDVSTSHASFQDLRDHQLYGSSAAAMDSRLASFETLPTKSIALAGTLSAVVPGSGQCYAGRCADGAAALLVNGALGGLTAASFLNEEKVLGGILAFIESWFYFGNIYSARVAADKYNRHAKESWIEDIRQHIRFDIVSNEYSKRMDASVTFDF